MNTTKNQLCDSHKCVAVFATHEAAETSVKELQAAGFDMSKLSIVGRDYFTDEHVVGFYNSGDRIKYWGKQGAFWGGLFGILFAPAFFWIPGVGPVLVGGIFGSLIMGMLEGGTMGALATGGLSALGAALFSIGIPKDSILSYEGGLKAGKFLLLVHGDAQETEKARELIQEAAESTHMHDPE